MKNRGLSGLIAFGKQLKKNSYHAVIDAYGKWQSIIPAYYSDAKIRIGHKKSYTSLFYTKTVVPAKNVSGSAIHHRLQLAEALTGTFPKVEFPKIYLDENEVGTAKKLISEKLNPELPLIMVSVLGSGNSKSLPAVQMANTLDIIAGIGKMQLLFNFMPDQQADAKAIYDLCSKSTQEKIVFDFYMKGLRNFMAVLSRCDALIGNEGGAVNMAKGLGIPTFTIYSPWINKASWDMLTGGNHKAVHLQDYFPELYGDSHPKKFRKNAAELYKKLTPELYRVQLEDFVRKIIS